ncbi:MAG: hypothetical protein IV108_09355 [Burkholderiales bacterium]|nr:hypothetical protein [Burkholderiales bacterium]
MKQSIMCLALLSAGMTGVQAQTCIPLAGWVKLTPDLTCQVSQHVSGVAFLGAPGTCFSVAVTGLLKGAGHAGMTLETMIGPITGSVAQSPTVLNEGGLAASTDEFNLPETRRVFTARSVIAFPGGRIFTADVGVIGAGAATEQLIVTGGDGVYQNAKGTIYSFNNVLGQWGPFQGKLCFGN